MPRNIAGVYTLPGGINPVVVNTTIQDTWANPTLSDVAQGVTDSLDRYGRGGMLAVLKGLDGNTASPAFSFSSDPDTGMYRGTTNSLSFAAGGSEILTLRSVGLLVGPSGNTANPAITFGADPDTGMYRDTANSISIGAGGVEVLTVRNVGLLVGPSGSAAAPSVVFGASPSTGLYRGGADILGFATSGLERLRINASGGLIYTKPTVYPRISFANTALGQWYAGGDDSGGNVNFQISLNADPPYFSIDSSGNVIFGVGTTPPALATNGNFCFNFTSNTNMRISARGSDGVTRVANITLA